MVPAALATLTLLATAACSSSTSTAAQGRSAVVPPASGATSADATSIAPASGGATSGALGGASGGASGDGLGGASGYCHTAVLIGGLYFKIEGAQSGGAGQYKSQVDAIENGVPAEISPLIANLHDNLIALIDGGSAAANQAQPQISSDFAKLDQWEHTHCQ
jgi:hypothetical protein